MAQPNLIVSTADIAGQAKLPKDAPRSTLTVRHVGGPPMAPGLGGFNIAPPATSGNLPGSEVARGEMRCAALLEPEHVPKPRLQVPLPPREAEFRPVVRMAEPSFVITILVIIAIIGTTLLALFDEPWKQVNNFPRAPTPPHGDPSSARSAHARLVVESQKGFPNEPLPLGISLQDASGGETVTMAGLAEGTELSLGTALSPGRWLVPALDLDKTFIAADQDFVGVMDGTVSLLSASGQLLDSRVVRFEWIEKRKDPVLELGPSEPAPMLPPLDAEQIAVLFKLGQDLLKHGDIAPARILLKRAALAGNAQAAFALGRTFDRTFRTQSEVLGFAPDVNQAREWYERAIKLGFTEASRHLERLSSTVTGTVGPSALEAR
jgi:hypothetical protein